jgi:predicted ATP-grasp superfamily ATP-dependent carboligase
VRVFVYEHLCGHPGGAALPASLRAEGRAMLSAVLEDLAACPEVCTVALVEPGLVGAFAAGVEQLPAHEGMERFEAQFRQLAGAADFSLVIAPELDGLLFTFTSWVEEEGGRLLGPSARAVWLTGDKLELAAQLRKQGVPTPPTVRFSEAPPGDFPLVCKPRYGAGSQATFLALWEEELAEWPARAAAEGWEGDLIVQPFVQGRSASLCVISGPAQTVLLPLAEQLLSMNRRFRYRGGRLPLEGPALLRRIRRLALPASRAILGLVGWFGIDLVLGPQPIGIADAVIEINPRLTTSYVGLRRLAKCNLMRALLTIQSGGHFDELEFENAGVEFFADGQAHLIPRPILL